MNKDQFDLALLNEYLKVVIKLSSIINHTSCLEPWILNENVEVLFYKIKNYE